MAHAHKYGTGFQEQDYDITDALAEAAPLSIPEYLESLFLAIIEDPANIDNADCDKNYLLRQLSRDTLREVIGRFRFGPAFPTELATPVEGKIYSSTITTTAHFTYDATEFILTIAFEDSADVTQFQRLRAFDSVIARPASGNDTIFRLWSPPVWTIDAIGGIDTVHARARDVSELASPQHTLAPVEGTTYTLIPGEVWTNPSSGQGTSKIFWDAVPGDLFCLTEGASVEVATSQLTRVGETSLTETDFDANNVSYEDQVFRLGANATEATHFTELGGTDSINLRSEDNTHDVALVMDFGGIVQTDTYNAHAIVTIPYSQRLNIFSNGEVRDDTVYTVYSVRSTHPEVKGSVFQYDGHFWVRVYENVLELDNIPDDLITLAKIAHGTPDRLIGYNAGGEPAEREAGDVVDMLETLTGDDRLSYTALSDTPEIPIDTTLWQGILAANTAYPEGSIFLHNMDLWLVTTAIADTNTATDPSTLPGAEQIDVGAPGDVIGVSVAGTVLTVTTRAGAVSTYTVGGAGGGGAVDAGHEHYYANDFPIYDSPQNQDRFTLTGDADNLESYVEFNTKNVETATVADFNLDDVGIYNNTFVMEASDFTVQRNFLSLRAGDRIFLRRDGGNVVLNLTGRPTLGTRNSHDVIEVASSDYTLSGTLVEGEDYGIYALQNRPAYKGTVFIYNGVFWRIVYSGHRREYGETFPTGITTGDKHQLTEDSNTLTQQTLQFTRTGETSSIETNWTEGDVARYISGDFRITLGTDAESERLQALQAGDQLTLIDPAFTSNMFTFLDAGVVSTINSVDTISWSTDNYTFDGGGAFANGTTYDVRVLQNSLQAYRGDVFHFNGRYWEKVYENLPNTSHGTTFPENPKINDLHLLGQDANALPQLTYTSTRTGETGLLVGDYDSGDMFLNNTHITITHVDTDVFAELVAGDILRIIEADGEIHTLTFNAAPVTPGTVHNGVVRTYWPSSDYTYVGPGASLTQGETYTIEVIQSSRQEHAAAVFMFNGTWWERIFDGTPRPETVPFGENWVTLWSDGSGYQTEDTDEPLDAGHSFADYSMLMFTARRSSVTDHHNTSVYRTYQDFRNEGVGIFSAGSHIQIVWINDTTFQVDDEHSSHAVYAIKGHI